MAIDYSAAMKTAGTEEEWLNLLKQRDAKEAQMKAEGTWNDNWIPGSELANQNPWRQRMTGSAVLDPAASYQKVLDNALYDDINARRKATAAQIQAQKEAMTPQYKAQRRQTAAQSELGKKSLAEYMAARGLTRSGESVQSEINRNAALNNELANINLQQAAAENALDLQALQSGLEYDAQAAQRQQALLQDTINYLRNQYNADREFNEAQRQYNLGLALQQEALNWDRNADRAATLAGVGYFDPYRELGYTDDDISRLTSAWQLANAPQASSGSGVRYVYRTPKPKPDDDDNKKYSSDFYRATDKYRFGDNVGELFTSAEYADFQALVDMQRTKNGAQTIILDALDEGRITEGQAKAALKRIGIEV